MRGDGRRPRQPHRPIRTLTGRILVYTKGLSLRIWDPINGVHEIDSGVASGGSPSLTSDGRFVAYAKNDGHGCYAIHLWDTHLRRRVKSLSGLADPGKCNDSTHISPGREVHHLGLERRGARRRLRRLSLRRRDGASRPAACRHQRRL